MAQKSGEKPTNSNKTLDKNDITFCGYHIGETCMLYLIQKVDYRYHALHENMCHSDITLIAGCTIFAY